MGVKKPGRPGFFCVLSLARLAPTNYAAFLHSARNFWRALPFSFLSSALAEHSFAFAVCAVNCLFGLEAAFFSPLVAGASLLATAGAAVGAAGATVATVALGGTVAAGA